MKSILTKVFGLGVAMGILAGCSPTQKDPPFAGVTNRQDVVTENVQLSPENPLAMMGAPVAWKKTSGKNPDGSRVIVALVGTGIDYTIPDLREALWINTGELGDRANNQFDDDGNGYIDDQFGYDFFSGDSNPYDWYGHDTFTASLIAATGRTNNQVIGMAPNAQLLIARYLGPDGRGNGFDAAEAIYYSINAGAKIIYLNWPQGGFMPVARRGDPTPLVVEAIKFAGSKNVLVVLPAGNGSNQDVPNFIKTVSKLENCVVVAGTTADGKLAKRSNFGKGLAAAAAPVEGATGYFPGGVVSKDLNTTSVAAAYAAGAAALIATQSGFGSAVKIKQALLSDTIPNRRGEALDVLSEGILSVSALK